MNQVYNVIVPRLDRTGPTNLAVDVANEALKNGWQVRLLYLSGGFNPGDFSKNFLEIRKVCVSDTWKLNGIVHTHGLRPDFIGWLIGWFGKCRIMSTLHGNFPQHLRFDYPNWKVFFAWAIWSSILKKFDVRVVISKTMLRHYKRLLPKISFSLVYNFRSSFGLHDSSPPRDYLKWIETQRLSNRNVLVFVGSVAKRKNIIQLAEFIAQTDNIAMVVCGTGPLVSELISFANEVGSEKFYFAGLVKNPEIFVKTADVHVLPSSAEGLPLVVLEACRLGIPSLMSNIAVHRELSNMGLGVTFNRYSFSDFKEKLDLLVSQRSVTNDVKLQSIWHDNFSPEIGFREYKNVITSLAESLPLNK